MGKLNLKTRDEMESLKIEKVMVKQSIKWLTVSIQENIDKLQVLTETEAEIDKELEMWNNCIKAIINPYESTG